MVTWLWTCTYKYTRGLFKWIRKRDRGGEERGIKIRETVCGLKRLTFPFSPWFTHREVVFVSARKISSTPNLICLRLFSSSAFLTDLTKAMLSRAAPQRKGNSISLIRRIDINNECANASLRERGVLKGRGKVSVPTSVCSSGNVLLNKHTTKTLCGCVCCAT